MPYLADQLLGCHDADVFQGLERALARTGTRHTARSVMTSVGVSPILQRIEKLTETD